MAVLVAFSLAACSSPFEDEQVRRARAWAEEETYPLPTATEIDDAERHLSQQPCIGALAQWHRRYARVVDWAGEHVDHARVWFNFRQADMNGYPAGRKIGRLREIVELDDSQFRLATGTYDLETGAIVVEHCGWNHPESPGKS